MKNNKFIIFFIVFAILFFAAGMARADKYENVVIENTTVETTISTEAKGVASAIAASQHTFYYGTKAWQASVATGSFDSNTAFSFGLAKRFKKTLINGSISIEGGKAGYGAAINWHF